jgi:proton-dependent oligopeptide transporter, POT family
MKMNSGLRTLFFTEMWERFSYYGMRALLVLYLTKFFKFDDMEAGKIYGLYTALVYLTPLIGGYLADRYLGNKNSIYIGGILMMFGHFFLSFSGIEYLYFGLVCLIIGNGFFKPNISTLLGRMYENNPEKRDSAFTIFYMGINIGGSFGPLLCGFLGEVYGWHYGFGLAGIGMFFGLIQFYFGSKQFDSLPKFHQLDSDSKEDTENDNQLKKFYLFALLTVVSIFFWIPYEQMGSSVNLYTDRDINRNLFGTIIPASIFQSLNGFLILVFAPIIADIWARLAISNKEPNVLKKFAIGLILLGLSYIFLYLNSYFSINGLSLLLMYYIFLTIAELFVSPVGLSMVGKLAPKQKQTSMMGIWFLSNSISHYISGFLSGAYQKWFSLNEFFFVLGAISILISLVLFFLDRSFFHTLRQVSK